ncbi:MAG: hypothetical protein U0263_03690 [Polyangiaceae bacterium]
MEPLPEPVARAIVQRYARILAAFGTEIGARPLVLPNADFFPDTFTGDAKSLKRLVKRMQVHAGMADIPIRPVLVDESEDAHGHAHSGGCGSGGCAVPRAGTDSPARLTEEGDGYRLAFEPGEVRHPVALTTTVARALAMVFLAETQTPETPIEAPVELSVDLAAVALGFGELLLEGSHVYSKGCGGPSIAKLTALGPAELALACALFVARGGHSARALQKELAPTQREALDEARALLKQNPSIVRQLDEDPARLAAGDFELGTAEAPLLSRWFGKKKRDDDLSLDELEAMLSAAPRPKKAAKKDRETDELSALVDEALRDARADAE